MYEDDLVHAYAEYLAQRKHLILVAGANQGSAFRYSVEAGRTKAPDLVSLREGRIFLFEVKVRPRDLFRETRGLSDFDSMVKLSASVDQRARIAAEAMQRMAATFGSSSDLSAEGVFPAVAAAGDFAPWSERLHGCPITVSRWLPDLLTQTVVVGVDPF